MSKLIRMTAADMVAAPVEVCDAQIAQKAHELLGYSVAFIRSPGERDDALLTALAQADIRPFTSESVQRYRRRQIWWAYLTNCGEYINRAACVIAAISAFAHIGTGAWTVIGWVKECSTLCIWLPLMINAGVLLLAMLIAVWTRRAHLAGFDWVASPLNLYTKPIPEFVLQQATEIAALTTSTRFYVWELVREHSGPPLPLRAMLALKDAYDKMHYLAVWESARFKDGIPPSAQQVAVRQRRGVRVREKAAR